MTVPGSRSWKISRELGRRSRAGRLGATRYLRSVCNRVPRSTCFTRSGGLAGSVVAGSSSSTRDLLKYVFSTSTGHKLRTDPDGVTLDNMTYALFSAVGAETSILAEGPGTEGVRELWTGEFWGYLIPWVGYRPAAAVGPIALYFGLSRRMEIGVMGLDGEMRAVIRQMNLDQTLTDEMVQESALAQIARSVPDEDPVRVYESADIAPSGSLRPPTRGCWWTSEDTCG